MKLKDPTPSRTPPGGSPLLDQQPSRDFVGDGGLMPGDQWREAIERALGVDSDPIEHTPDWAYERVLTIREIGNGVRNESGCLACGAISGHLTLCRHRGRPEPARNEASGETTKST